MMLTVTNLAAGYGPAQVLFDVSFAVGAGEVVTLLGRNGMGKTTTIRTLMGLLPARGGAADFEGAALLGKPPYRIAQRGLGLVPEGRQVFPTLSVEENLVATATRAARRANGRCRASTNSSRASPSGAANMGNQLSGGEQQMLAIGRALMTNPKLLILDEATEGLAPLIRTEIWACLARLKREGQAILLVDKHLDALAKIADRHVVIEKGHTVWTGTSAALAADAKCEDEIFAGVATCHSGRAISAFRASASAWRGPESITTS